MISRYSLLPEIVPFMEVIYEKQPITGNAVAVILDKINSRWMEEQARGVVIKNSLLTPGGFPMEFNFRSDDDAICYTLEPGMAKDSIHSKLQFINSQFNISDIEKYTFINPLCYQQEQRFGCWISARHDRNALKYKLYLEISRGNEQDFVKNLIRDIPHFPADILIKPMLLGVFPEEHTVAEYYFKLIAPSNSVLHKIFETARVSSQLPFVISCLSWLSSSPPSILFHNLSLGISFQTVKGKVPTLTIFVHCPEIFSSNLIARKQILSFVEQIGGQMEIYEAITEPLQRINIPYPVHSILTIKVKSDKKITCAVGLSPW